METKARIKSLFRDIETNKTVLTIEVDDAPMELAKLREADISLQIKKWHDPRSDKANRLLWACCRDLGQALSPPLTKEEVYEKALRDYGQGTYVVVKKGAAEAFAANWKVVDVLGDMDVNGQPGVQMHCYYGSSTYNTKEFSILLDGLIEEMRQVGISPPPDERVKEALEEWERALSRKKNAATSASQPATSSNTMSSTASPTGGSRTRTA